MKKLVLMLVLLLTFSLAVGAVAPQTGGELSVGLDADPPMLDPHMSTARVDRQVFMSLYDTLVELDSNLNIVPGLVKNWQVKNDGEEYVFELREDVLFHDGTKFNAEAVKFNFERMLDPEFASPRKSDLDLIKEIEVLDEYWIRIILSEPYVPFLATLADRAGMMVSPTAVEKYGADFANQPVGTGPFKFVEREIQDHITLKKNENYWQEGLPYLDKVVYRPFPDGNVRVINFASGDLDFIDELPPKDVEKIKNQADLNLNMASGLGYQGIWINKAKAPFANDKLTQALNLALNREAIVNVVFGETAYVANSPFPPGTVMHDENRESVKADPAKAKELLKSAGQASGYEFNLMVAPDPTAKQTAQLIQSMASQVGIKINIELLEFGTLVDRLMSKNYQAALLGWSGRVDADGNTFRFFHSEGSMNQSSYTNPEVDQILEQTRKVADTAERKALYKQMMTHLDQELPYIFVYHPKEIKAYKDHVHDFVAYPDGLIRLEKVWVTDSE